MSSPLELARPDLLDLEPYQHALWEPALERLHANENPWRAPGDNSIAGLNRYPEPQPEQLAHRLADLYQVPRAQVLVGRGSDEAIDLVVRAFCRAGVDAILILPPTFGMYKVAARIQGAAVNELVLTAATGFAPTADAILERWRPQIKLVFLCSPNNPTGNAYDETMMLDVAGRLSGKALLVVDEAYLEFSRRPSLTRWQSKFPNLVVLRTLSKAFALAGARCGALIANADIVGLLQRIIPPYAIPSSTVEIVEHVLSAPQIIQTRARVEAIIAERQRLAHALPSVSGVRRVYPSDANFLLVEFDDAARALDAARNAGLLLRDVRRQPGLARCLRISVGNPQQNDRLLRALASP